MIERYANAFEARDFAMMADLAAELGADHNTPNYITALAEQDFAEIANVAGNCITQKSRAAGGPAFPLDYDYIGRCPDCLRRAPFLNIGRDHWAYCPVCRFRWYIGGNLFSGWRDETEERWQENERRLAACRGVTPVRYLPQGWDIERLLENPSTVPAF